ncbi:NXPE family member 3-like isoform X1 [Lytechinus pictus]|uniref:NXPE family member 3-like isoform X1 n=2 Tax=Lytechinus pictus TaxID=7653 RepID=UPI0030BA0019
MEFKRTLHHLLVVILIAAFLMTMFYQSERQLRPNHINVPPTFKYKNYTVSNLSSTSMKNKMTSYTSNAYSTARIIDRKDSYQVNDSLKILITAMDINNASKSYGGDYFRVKLYTPETKSSWSIDVTNDLGNGSYIADVTLRWPGKVSVIVTLVHPSEAVEILQRTRVVEPGKTIFTGRYSRNLSSGSEIYEDTMCIPKIINNRSLCNFTDGRTGYPWFCVAPSNKNLSCDDWKRYATDNKLSQKFTMNALSKEEEKVFKVYKLPITNPPLPLDVKGDIDSWKKSVFAYQDSLPSCKPGQHLHNPTPSGFYAKDIWFSDQCKFRRFTKPEVLQCLQNRAAHIFGDSTSRQLYIELASRYKPEIKAEPPKDKSQSIAGPLHSRSTKFNISINFKFHGHPARPSFFLRKDTINYIINELDDLTVDSRTVVLICVGTHYTTYPLEMYEERMRDIKAAVQRLHMRSPQTLVIFKSANTREHETTFHVLQNSEWYIRTLDQTMRALLKDAPELAFIDSWDMTIAQNFKDNVHPNQKVVVNLMNNFLSYICPVAS